MKRKAKVLIAISGILAIAIAFAVYLFLAPEDWRHGDGICEIHGKRMRTEVVHNCTALIDHTPEYFEAKKKLFPNAGIEYGQDLYGNKRGKIYVCDECEKARDEWSKK